MEEDKRKLHKPRLDGKTVFIVGSERDSAPMAESLREAGATVTYPITKIPGKLTLEQAVDARGEIVSHKPHLVIIFDPMTKDKPTDQFDKEPAIILGKKLIKEKYPVLIMDRWIVDKHGAPDERELSRAEQETMATAGIKYFHRPSTALDNKFIVTLNQIIARNNQKAGGLG